MMGIMLAEGCGGRRQRPSSNAQHSLDGATLVHGSVCLSGLVEGAPADRPLAAAPTVSSMDFCGGGRCINSSPIGLLMTFEGQG